VELLRSRIPLRVEEVRFADSDGVHRTPEIGGAGGGRGTVARNCFVDSAAFRASPMSGRNVVVHRSRSCGKIPGRANAFYAKAQRLRGAKKAIVHCGPCALAALREIVYFFTAPQGAKEITSMAGSAPVHRGSSSICAFCRGAPWGALGQGKPSPYKTCLAAAPPRGTTGFSFPSPRPSLLDLSPGTQPSCPSRVQEITWLGTALLVQCPHRGNERAVWKLLPSQCERPSPAFHGRSFDSGI
jgi:hypothetical protein